MLGHKPSINDDDANHSNLRDLLTLRNAEYGVDEDPGDKPIEDLYIKRMHTAVLNKAHRKINLDKNVKGDWKKTKKSLTQWIKLLRRIDDHKL